MLVTGLLLIVLPPLFIVMGGIPRFSELTGQGEGEGFAYALAAFLLLLIFVGVVFLLIGVGMIVFRRRT